jgi:pimeloyl-ACP methyl ester carboxylesterase
MASNREQSILIGGHDRGARICHRLAVDENDHFGNFIIRGILLLDIVPTLVQWQTFSDSKASKGTFHWPFLANVDLATSMIKAQGGDVWCCAMIERWSGKDHSGLKSLQAHGAVKIYSQYMAQDSVIRASCEDYRAGAEEDIQLQKQDQASGRKLLIDTLVLYSTDYLGSRYDVENVWHQWSERPSTVFVQGFGGGVGHFIAEEGPEETASAIDSFWQRLNNASSST